MTRENPFVSIDALIQQVNALLGGRDLREAAVAVTSLLCDIYEQVADSTGHPGSFDRLDDRAAPIAQDLLARYGRDQMVNVSLWVLFDLAMTNLDPLVANDMPAH
jgi:hypothetical protein